MLCLAEGEGRNAMYLAEKGYAVTGVDMSEVGINKMNAEAARRRLEITGVVADLSTFDMSTPGGWDVIVSIFAHMPPDVRRSVHARAVGALAPGGRLILEAYTPGLRPCPPRPALQRAPQRALTPPARRAANVGRGTGGPPEAGMCMTLAELRQELAGLAEVAFARLCDDQTVGSVSHACTDTRLGGHIL